MGEGGIDNLASSTPVCFRPVCSLTRYFYRGNITFTLVKHYQGCGRNSTVYESQLTQCTAFEGPRRIGSGPLPQVALQVKALADRGDRAPLLVFDDASGQLIDLDLRGTAEDVERRLAEAAGGPPPAAAPEANSERVAREAARRPGRPKLGVVGREVTLLPRHWEWLNCQPGGASVALRRLVDEARRVYQGRDRVRRAQEAAYRFMSAMAGNEPGFEEATRALFAGNRARFEEMVGSWPGDLRDHATKLAAGAFPE
jgi:uncharacterized protein